MRTSSESAMTSSGATVLGTHIAALSKGWQACATSGSMYAAATEAIALGFRVLEVPLFDHEHTPIPRLPTGAKDVRLWAYTALPAAVHLPQRPEHARVWLGRALEWCESAGASYLVGGLGWSPGAHLMHPSRPEDRTLTIEVLRDCAQEAMRRGITLAIEPANRYETSLCCTLAQGVEMVSAIDHPNMCLLGNTLHMHLEEANVVDALNAAKEYLIGLHLVENTGGKLGSGAIAWESIWRTLGENEFAGALIVTPWNRATAESEEGKAAASDSFRFLRAGFRSIQFAIDSRAEPVPADTPAPVESKPPRKRKRSATKSYRTR